MDREEESIMPQKKKCSEEIDRGQTFKKTDLSNPRKRKLEKSAAAQRAEKLRMKKGIVYQDENFVSVMDLTTVYLSQINKCSTQCSRKTTGLSFKEVHQDYNTWLP